MSVRPYRLEDRDELRDVFARAGDGDEPLFGEEADEWIWLLSYLEHSPRTVLLAFVEEQMVGYLTGSASSAGELLPSEGDRVVEAVRRFHLWRRRAALTFFARTLADRVRDGRTPHAAELEDPRWPAHLHTRIVPEGRGHGAGTALVRAWQELLLAEAVPGCHLQVTAEHARAVGFFESVGFIRHGPPALIPGMREQGRRIHQQTMVWPAPVEAAR